MLLPRNFKQLRRLFTKRSSATRDFLQSIAPLRDCYEGQTLRFVARRQNDRLVICKAMLFLEITSEAQPLRSFQSSRVIAAQLSLNESGITAEEAIRAELPMKDCKPHLEHLHSLRKLSQSRKLYLCIKPGLNCNAVS